MRPKAPLLECHHKGCHGAQDMQRLALGKGSSGKRRAVQVMPVPSPVVLCQHLGWRPLPREDLPLTRITLHAAC